MTLKTVLCVMTDENSALKVYENRKPLLEIEIIFHSITVFLIK